MVETTCKAILFDLDGVLIDSTPAVTRVWRKWAIKHGFEAEELVRRAHGRPSISTIRDYLPHADIELENREVEQAEIEDLEGVVALPGAQMLLDALPSKRWTIVTSCTRELAHVRLGAAGLRVPERLVTCSDVQNGKPDPEPYLKGAGLLGCHAKECIVVEDVPSGIRSGKAAGARVVAFTTTMSEEELRATSADWIVRGCESMKLVRASMDGITLTLDDSWKSPA
jgi:mannitol-1-/sugar-/sorbitol-6-phosphatase